MVEQNCPVVALLGAGATIDAGLLSSIDLTGALIDAIEADHEPDLQRALGLILGGIALQRGIDGALRAIPLQPDVETVLRVAQQLELRATHPLASYVSSWSSALERLAPAGDGTVFRRLNERAREVMKERLGTPHDPARVKYLAGLCRLGFFWSDGTGRGPYPRIFTLNYDLCLETALVYEKVQFTTGFRDGLWNSGCFQQTDRVRIYKLHGSFGWVRDPQTLLLYDRDNALGRSDVLFMSDDTPDDLVFATETKLQALQPYLWLTHEFSEAVTAAKYVVIVGYNFGDEHVNQIVGQAMAVDPEKRLLVVSPNFEPSSLEHAKGITYYQERVIAIKEKAREALLDRDTVHKELNRLQAQSGADRPF